VLENIAAAILGHESDTMSYGVYSGWPVAEGEGRYHRKVEVSSRGVAKQDPLAEAG
jgi:hypothetical protein